MIGRYKPVQRGAPSRPLTLKDYLDQQREAGERRRKRADKRRILWQKKAGQVTQLSRSALIDQLDHLWSLAVRRRDRIVHAGRCLICKIRPIDLAYHIVPRGDHATRWDMSNGVGACAPCNRGEQMNRLNYRQKHIEIFGQGHVERLEAKARVPARFSIADLVAIRDGLKAIVEGRQ